MASYTDSGTDPTCDFGGDATAWYTWNATTTDIVFTSGAGFPGIEILDGTCGSFTSLGCVNNVDGAIGGLTIGTDYYIIIWDDGTPGVPVEFCISEAPAPPTNDACANALSVGAGSAVGSMSTQASTNIENLTPCSANTSPCSTSQGGTGTIDFSAGVWYVYNSTTTEDLVFDTEGSSFDTEIQVFTGTCGSLTCIGGDDDSGTGSTSLICIESTASFAPVDYYIYVDGHGGATGDLVLNITANAILPIALISFEGEKLEDTNRLFWKTASEENTSNHIIERSSDGSNWQEIGDVVAAGFSSEIKSYEFIDTRPVSNSFYRLKSIDFDGTYEYSDIINISREKEDFEIESIFPNPTQEDLNITFEIDQSRKINITVIDITGRTIFTDIHSANKGPNMYTLNTTALTNGIYFINMSDGIHNSTKRFIKN